MEREMNDRIEMEQRSLQVRALRARGVTKASRSQVRFEKKLQEAELETSKLRSNADLAHYQQMLDAQKEGVRGVAGARALAAPPAGAGMELFSFAIDNKLQHIIQVRRGSRGGPEG
eukprot:552334-Prorocentrum_minimum.AAC.1